MENRYVRSMLFGALLISFSPILVKGINLSPTAIAFYRFLFGTIPLAFYLFITKEPLSKNSIIKAIPSMALAGLFFSLDLWVWHRSIFYIGAGLGTALANTQVFYLVLIGYFFYKEKPKALFYLGALIAILGIILVSYPLINFEQLSRSTFGVFFALLTGLAYASMNTFLRKATTFFNPKSSIPVLGMSICSTLFSLIFFLGEQNFVVPSSQDFLLLIIYGSGVHFVGWLIISKSINYIPLALTGLILLLQPILATIMGSLIYNESLSLSQIIGLLFSLAGIYIASLGRGARNELKA